MAIKKIADYQDGKYRSFPSESIEKYKLKEKDYFLDYCKSFLHLYTNSNSRALVRYESEYLSMLERYATGEQGAKLVKEKLLRKDKTTGQFYGKMGKVFQTYDILPEMLDVIFSINAKQSYSISTLAYDDISSQTKETQKAIVKYLLDRNTRLLLEKLELTQEGVSLSQAEQEVYSEDDVDAIFDSGGIQLDWEMAAKAVCNNVYVDSNAKKIENRCTEELLKWGFTAVRSYIDKSTGTPKLRNVDMRNLIIENSKENDFSDKKRFAEVRWISLIELKELCPSLTYDQYEEIIDGAGTYSINSHFKNYMNEENYRGFYNGSSSLFDDIQVPILDAQWLATDVEHSLYFKKNDIEVSKKVKPGTELSRKEIKNKNYIEKKKFVKRYDAIWLIGSDILLEYGVAKSNCYYGPKGNRTPRLDLSIIKTGKKSLVDRCRNFVEDINLLVAKLRHAIATLPPAPQLVVYQHALRGVSLNGKPQQAADLIRGLIEEGILVANGQNEKGEFISANGGKAVENLNLHVIEQVTTYSNEIQANINRMRHVLGLPEGLDGTAGNPYQGVGKQQLAAMGSSNATFPILSLIGPLFSEAFLNCVGAYQALATDKEIDLKDMSVSEHASRIFKLSKNFSSADFNIKFSYAPNDEDKEFLINKIVELAAIHKSSNGAMGIQDSEYLMLYRLIKADRFEHAIRMLARFERLRKAEARITSQQLQEQNGQIQMQSTQVSEQEKRSTIIAKADEDRKTVLLEKGLDSINESRKAMVDASATGEQGNTSPQVVETQKEEAESQIVPVLGQVIGNIEEQNAAKAAQMQQAMAEQEQQEV